MPTLEWLKKEFHYGYTSGNMVKNSDEIREREERKIGGNYIEIVQKLLVSHIQPNFSVLELGPGRGSWSQVILSLLNRDGKFTTLDFQDVSKWINSVEDGPKVEHFQIDSFDYSFLKNDEFNFFWSFGVLCHNNIDSIYQIFHNIYPKMKKGAILIHQYADWEKLENFGWEKGGVPPAFKEKMDNEIWWPRNNQKAMRAILEGNGYEVLAIDCNLVQRDSIFICKKI
ncbi:hypothetical protein JWV37_06720 [Sulfurospirillum sp. T05]|uniref:Methyltransferase domain-containing protein n=1 Tax=Sulfurospirillum tamanense TaxID=2813362 RepID=A0ABS2WS15_9BACT|nr:hypothetical protein [Sulfurospirillum tamanensis]MBN2964466.1 hypothetical protein [Sulfurospirillum tamanensis]